MDKDYGMVLKFKDPNSVPEVYVNGERIEGLVVIEAKWKTRTDKDPGMMYVEAVSLEKLEGGRVRAKRDMLHRGNEEKK